MVWDATNPSGATKIKDSDDEIRDNFAAIEAVIGSIADPSKFSVDADGNVDMHSHSINNVSVINAVLAAELSQLETMGATTIVATQWAWLGAYDAESNARAYLATASQDDLVDGVPTKILLNAESYDPGSNFDLANSRYVIPVTGYYQVNANISFKNVVADKSYIVLIYVNEARYSQNLSHAAFVSTTYVTHSDLVYGVAGQYIELYGISNAGVNTVDVSNGTGAWTYMSVHMVTT